MRNVHIDILPRIHIGLLSMHNAAPRVNGGIGFAIDGPKTRIEAVRSPTILIRDERSRPFAPAELSQLRESLSGFALERQLQHLACIRISGDMQTHVGMGSATAIRLGSIEALALVNDLSLTKSEFIEASGRGGTSGIGVNSYFGGGLICDLGRPNEGGAFKPSSAATGARPPLALPAIDLPSWPLLLCIPRGIQTKTQAEEAAFFSRATPLPSASSFEAAYTALFEVYASALEADYPAFCRGIDHMQQTKWKAAERAEYGEKLDDVFAGLRNAGADCVGMSSLGPMLFAFVEPSRLRIVEEGARAMDCTVYQTLPANFGRRLSISDA